MELLKQKIKKSETELKTKLRVGNALGLPRLVKVVVATGTGKAKDPKRNTLVADRLTRLTGQKAAPRGAKKSIASFKVRQGDTVGWLVTLRGERMMGFLDKLINVVLPRTRDFKGLDPKNIDEMGNLTLGVKEHVVFPETADEELKDVFGLAITVVTTAKDQATALAYLTAIGFPFKKAK